MADMVDSTDVKSSVIASGLDPAATPYHPQWSLEASSPPTTTGLSYRGQSYDPQPGEPGAMVMPSPPPEVSSYSMPPIGTYRPGGLGSESQPLQPPAAHLSSPPPVYHPEQPSPAPAPAPAQSPPSRPVQANPHGMQPPGPLGSQYPWTAAFANPMGVPLPQRQGQGERKDPGLMAILTDDWKGTLGYTLGAAALALAFQSVMKVSSKRNILYTLPHPAENFGIDAEAGRLFNEAAEFRTSINEEQYRMALRSTDSILGRIRNMREGDGKGRMGDREWCQTWIMNAIMCWLEFNENIMDHRHKAKFVHILDELQLLYVKYYRVVFARTEHLYVPLPFRMGHV